MLLRGVQGAQEPALRDVFGDEGPAGLVLLGRILPGLVLSSCGELCTPPATLSRPVDGDVGTFCTTRSEFCALRSWELIREAAWRGIPREAVLSIQSGASSRVENLLRTMYYKDKLTLE